VGAWRKAIVTTGSLAAIRLPVIIIVTVIASNAPMNVLQRGLHTT
jgi:hypothetical protein